MQNVTFDNIIISYLTALINMLIYDNTKKLDAIKKPIEAIK